MTAVGSLELAIVAGALACGGGGAVAALRSRAAARADRLALRAACERERTFVAASRRLADAARTSVDAVREALAAAVCTAAPGVDGILLYEEHDGALACVFTAGERVAYYAGSRVALDDVSALPARALAAEHRITLDDRGVRRLHPADVAALAVPLAADGGRSCVLVATSRRPLDPPGLERLVQVAEQASPAYAIAREREDDRQRAEYDGLTGLLTPRAFRQRLGLLVERARFSAPARLALLFVDTDRFKEWNDAYGHASGDALLRELAGVLRGAVTYDEDLVARNGGDEFCIVLTGIGKADAIERAETVRRRIGALDLAMLRPGNAAATVRITASVGVAAYPADASNANELLERADAAMYFSKRNGRNAVAYADVDRSFACLDRGSLLGQQLSSERPGSSFVSALPTVL